ncbi:Serpentine Receptor, class Z [Caenorhabditis elegans]|uniref:Serpentine Receptor, class Z n=1 Tax=Caenorhabditis elegans TaxID=6239 RepID=G5EEI3_CAEEL|nr:Serpentine Receptor, class Z [Caenorhabditis elegans]CAI46576.2 Serpentine Receptor, class Z [Caenorhabditis elegans]|eukprot:NP_001024078.2 Uncharacterized protein CELE_R11G10.3 [Caenorhabditis elegans]
MLGLESNSPNCTSEAQWFVGIYTVAIYAPLALIYIVVASLFIRHPNVFHPLFVISFFLVLLAHTTSNFILFFRNLLEFFFINQLLFSILEFILISANYYTQPIVILALLERLAATVFVSNYEKSCQWVPYICGQFICIVFVVLMSLYQHEESFVNNIQVALSFVICLCLVVLFLVNRYKTANSVGKSTLTTRYQLAENIKALRIFVPFIVLDNVISLMFVITSYTISIARKFDEDECNKDPRYVPIFIVFRTIAIIIQISMAVIVVYMHESMKLWSFKDCYRSNRSQDVSITMVRPDILKIKNVLGKNIVEQETGENYFAQLSKQWQKV